MVMRALRNATTDNVLPLCRQARREFQRLQSRPSTLRAFFRNVRLSLPSIT